MSFLMNIFPQETSFAVLSSVFISQTLTIKLATSFLKEAPGGALSSILIGTVSGLLAGKLVERTIRKYDPPDLVKMIEKIKGCKATDRLYEQAEQAARELNESSLSIKMVANMPFGGNVKINGEIEINSSQSQTSALSSLIFELANMTQIQKFQEHMHKAECGELDRERYAKGVERIEQRTEEIYCEVMKAARKEGVNWASSLESYESQLAILLPESIRLFHNKIHGHTAMYYKHWDEKFGLSRAFRAAEARPSTP